MPDSDSERRPPSYNAILRAAVAEFAEHGRDGVRMEKVAARAGFNRSLVYRYFLNRDSLYEAALRSVFSDRFELLEDLPEDLGELFEVWADRFERDDTFIRMLMREAIERCDAEPVCAELRHRYYQQQVRMIRGLQARNRLPAGIEPENLLLMLMSVLVFPHVLPQVAYLVTGRRIETDGFRGERKKLFRMLADQLSKS